MAGSMNGQVYEYGWLHPKHGESIVKNPDRNIQIVPAWNLSYPPVRYARHLPPAHNSFVICLVITHHLLECPPTTSAINLSTIEATITSLLSPQPKCLYFFFNLFSNSFYKLSIMISYNPPTLRLFMPGFVEDHHARP